MATSKAREAIQVLHSLVPIALVVYFLGSYCISVFKLQPTKTTLVGRTKTTVLSLVGAVITVYAMEAALIVAQIFTSGGQLATRDYNIFAQAQVITWLLCCSALSGSELPPWYPYLGASFISLCGEISLIVLSLTLFKPRTGQEWVQYSLMLFRVTALTCFPLAYLIRKFHETPATDEETTPLLAQSKDVPTESPARAFGFGSLDNDEAAVAAAAEDEVAKKRKKEEEKIEKLRNRIKEEGGWYRYVLGYKIFVPYIWPYEKPALILNMIATGLCLLATRALNILTPRQLGIVVTLLGASKQKALEALAIYVVLIWISSYSGIKAVQRLLWVPVMTNAQVSLQCASYDHIMDLSCDFHDEKQSGDLYTAMGQGDTLVDLLDTILLDCLPIVIDLTLALVYFYILFDTYLVLIGAATIVLYLWTFISLMDIAMKIHRKRVVAGRKQQAILYDTMGEWRTVTYFNRIPFAKQLYSSGVALTQRFRVQLQYLWAFGFGMNELTLQIGGAAAFFFAAYQVIYIGKDVGSFVTLTSYWWTFTEPIHQIARIHRDILSNLVKAEELLTLFRTRPSIQDGPNEMQITEGKVVFDEAGFHYAGKDSFIKDLSFVANSGKTIALIGETGAGKSTILKLLFRFYDLTEGSISIDGQDIRNVSLSSLRQHIGVVPQDASLFNDTVLANVRFARLEATEDEVKKACEAAAIHDRIMGFPEGYQTKVGEKGQKLSGGELQRIAIARAILKNPKIILLDEATSSVDNETEVKIQAGLNKLCQGRTTFVVAHRLSTIMDADMILVIGDGKIIEQGAPADLLKKKGKYYKLWSKQMGIMDVLEKADESDTIVGGTTPAGTSIETIPGGGEEEDDDYYSDDIDDFDSEEDEDEGEYEKVKAESEENIKQQRESQDKQTVRGKRGNGIDKQSQSNTLEVTEKTKRNNEGNGKEESSGVAGTTSAKEVQSRAGNARRRRQRAVRSQQVPNVVVDSGPPLSAGESLGKEEPPAPAPTPAAGVPEKNGGAIPDDLTPLIHHP